MAEKLRLIGKDGFTLIEILIAITVFAVFVSIYITSQGFNLVDSANMKEELLVKVLAENKINEVVIAPPELNDGALIAPVVKKFEEHPEYQYEIEFSQMSIPNLSKIFFAQEDAEEQNKNLIQKRVMEKVGEVLEKLIWQVKVTVTNSETGFNFTLSRWIYKGDEKIDFAGIL